MSVSLLRTIAVAIAVWSATALVHAGERPRPTTNARAAAGPYADPRAPYKANRLSSSYAEPIVNLPGQTTVLTREVLDDMRATSLRDALRSTAGVTVGR
jgi:outer membrane receptor for monomeric catechols